MKNFKLSAVVVAIAALGTSAFAQSVTGTWKGKLASLPPLPANIPAEQKKMVDAMMTQVKKMVIVLNLKSDKTYTVTMQNAPQGTPAQKPESGTWRQVGKTIFVKSPKTNKEQQIVVNPDGKSLTLNTPAGPGGKTTKIVFTR